MARFGDYTASLADLAEYPADMLDQLTGAYDADVLDMQTALDAATGIVGEKDALIAQLQSTVTQLIQAGVGNTNPPPVNETVDEADAATERAETYTLDDYMNEESEGE